MLNMASVGFVPKNSFGKMHVSVRLRSRTWKCQPGCTSVALQSFGVDVTVLAALDFMFGNANCWQK
jgi:hypothetical protein